jgi:hypothetical protein
MTPGEQLRQIERLTLDDGLPYADLRAIEFWCQLVGPDYDHTVLEESSQARISLIHYRLFDLVAGAEDTYKRRKS